MIYCIRRCRPHVHVASDVSVCHKTKVLAIKSLTRIMLAGARATRYMDNKYLAPPFPTFSKQTDGTEIKARPTACHGEESRLNQSV